MTKEVTDCKDELSKRDHQIESMRQAQELGSQQVESLVEQLNESQEQRSEMKSQMNRLENEIHSLEQQRENEPKYLQDGEIGSREAKRELA